jgi:TPR repeat protein
MRARLTNVARTTITTLMRHRAILVLGVLGFLTLVGNASLSQQDAPVAQGLTPRDLAALSRLREQPTWLFPAAECPADVMPAYQEDSHYFAGKCKGDLATCADRCQANDGGDCYALALALEGMETETQSDEVVFEALYLRACRLGVVSGCTNRAAGMTVREPESADACAARTFAQTCERDDAWGCTMYGYHLMTGRGVEKDLDRAARMFRRACGYDETFAACTKAKRLLQEIEDERAEQPASPD